MNVAERCSSERASQGQRGGGPGSPGELPGSLYLETGRPETGSREEARVLEGFSVFPDTGL